jgi:hypothetical protein
MAARLQVGAMLEAGIVDWLEPAVAAQRLARFTHVPPAPKKYAGSLGVVSRLVY